MNSLASRDSYIQKLASKICARDDPGPRSAKFVPFRGHGEEASKNSKRKQKRLNRQKAINEHKKAAQAKPSKSAPSSSPATPAADAQTTASKKVANGKKVKGEIKGEIKDESPTSTFTAVDILRKRLHEKIEESKGQGTIDPSSDAVQAKRAKRKLERERKKRKKKEFQLKKMAEVAGLMVASQIKQEKEEEEEEKAPIAATANKRDETAVLFNTVETVDEAYDNPVMRKRAKKARVKGELTPLVGRNYRQLLGRVEARKARLSELRATDGEKARALEEKMRWTNVLYKAEGLKIKDDEAMLRTSLKRKEKQQVRREQQWSERSQNVEDKMQRRQNKRQRNLTKQKKANAERKKDRARKKGRMLPGDLKKVCL